MLKAHNYYPFSSTLPERTFSNGRFCGYSFRFNGQEQDNEVAGTGNIMTAEFWMYDGRLGRRWNVDPVVKVYQSPYSGLDNNPIILYDPLGNTTKVGEWIRNNLPGIIAAPLAGAVDMIAGISKIGSGINIAQFNYKEFKKNATTRQEGIKETWKGFLSIFGLNDLFDDKDNAPTSDDIKLPQSINQVMIDVKDEIYRRHDAGSLKHPRLNGMHAWHAGTNAALANRLGPAMVIFLFIGGIVHETPIDKNSWIDEQNHQGTFNHIMDNIGDIISNTYGLYLGMMYSNSVAVDRAIEIGNRIPGPSDPDPDGKSRTPNRYDGDPRVAWGPYKLFEK